MPLLIDMTCCCGAALHIELHSSGYSHNSDICQLAKAWNEAHAKHPRRPDEGTTDAR